MNAEFGHPGCADTRRCRLCAQMRTAPLVTALCCAVPLYVHHANQLVGETKALQLAQWRHLALITVSERGDSIEYPVNNRDARTSASFNSLAMGMAAMSFHRGGFQAFGLHWCATHSPGGTVPTTSPVCAECLRLESENGELGACDCCVVDVRWPVS